MTLVSGAALCNTRYVDVVVETIRMVLRRFTLEDTNSLVRLDSDPKVRRYVEDGEPVNAEQAVSTIEHWLAWYRRSDLFGCWVAINKESGEFLGWLHFRPSNGGPDDEPELGYRLASEAWGHGYATEGTLALINRGFTSPVVSRVVAETMAVHVSSRRVLEKAGMRLVRSFRADWPVHIPGDEHGDVEYAITRAEWEKRMASSRPEL